MQLAGLIMLVIGLLCLGVGRAYDRGGTHFMFRDPFATACYVGGAGCLILAAAFGVLGIRVG